MERPRVTAFGGGNLEEMPTPRSNMYIKGMYLLYVGVPIPPGPTP